MKFLYLIIVIFLCGLIGTVVGEIALFFIPSTSYFYNFFNSSISSPTFSINNLNLIILSFSLSLVFKITPGTLLGIIIGCIYGIIKL